MLAPYRLATFLQTLAGIMAQCCCSLGYAQIVTQSFVVHGTTRSCSAITQMDSAMASNSLQFFKGWSEKDYADAMAWSLACAKFGWHIPGRPRIPLLQAQHDTALGPAAVAEPSGRAAPTHTVRATYSTREATETEAFAKGFLTAHYLAKHFRQEAVRVAQQAHLDIGANGASPGSSSSKTPAQMTNRLTADKIVLLCARQSNPGEPETRPLRSDWRKCESEEASAYNRLVAGNELPAEGRGIVVGCAGAESFIYLERCMETVAVEAEP